MNVRTLVRTAALAGTVVLAPLAGAQVGKTTLLDPNLATEAQLATVPGLSPALVKALVDKRPFLRMADVHAVLSPTLGADALKATYAKLFLHLDLNAASKEEILLIPGVGSRMLHEFEEYRPYRSLAQFHREIDKYVDDTELARLEQYVFVPIDLNTASDADILTIPGLGNRMLHEFKEYRPYKAMDQFRREIGKYVSKEEVARYERYVAIN